jgi:hypothetical protein
VPLRLAIELRPGDPALRTHRAVLGIDLNGAKSIRTPPSIVPRPATL